MMILSTTDSNSYNISNINTVIMAVQKIIIN